MLAKISKFLIDNKKSVLFLMITLLIYATFNIPKAFTMVTFIILLILVAISSDFPPKEEILSLEDYNEIESI